MKLSPKFSGAFCPNINDPVVKLLDLTLGEDGVYEFFLKIQTDEFKKWKGDDKFPYIETSDDGDIRVFNNRGDSTSLSTFIKTTDIKALVNRGKQSYIDTLLSEKEPIYNQSEGKYYDKNGKEITKRVTQIVKRDWKDKLDNTPNSIFFKQKGTILHKYLELLANNIIQGKSSSNLDELRANVYKELKDIPDMNTRVKEFFYMDDKQIEKLYNYLHNFIGELKKNDPGIIIKTEQRIHSVKEDLASTIDLMTIGSDGKINLYDYKGINFYSNGLLGIKPEVKEWKKDDASAQLEYRKKILIDEYGAKPEDFQHIRAIPIDLQYEAVGKGYNERKGFLGVDIGEQNGKEYLRMIPSRHELSSTKAINDQLKVLFNRRALIKKSLDSNYKDEAAKAEHFRLNKLIENLQLKQEFNFIFKDMKEIFSEVERGSNITDEKNPYYLTNKRLLELYADLQAYDGLILAFSDKYEELESNRKQISGEIGRIELKPEKTKEDKDRLDGLKSQLNQANYIKASLSEHTVNKEVIKQDILDIVKERVSKETGINLNSINKPISLGHTFEQLSDINHNAFKALSKLVRQSEHEIYDTATEEFKKVAEIDTKLKEWIKTKGLTIQQAFNQIIDYNKDKSGKDRDNLIMEYSRESINEIKTKQADKDLEWLKQNTFFNEEAYKEYETNKFKEIDRTNKDEERRALLKSLIIDRYNVKVSSNALLNPQNYFIKPVDIPKNKNPKWLELHKVENKPLLEYYNMLLEYNHLFDSSTDRDIHKYFIPNFRKSLMEQVLSEGMGTLNIGKLNQFLKDSLMVREDDETLGSVDLMTGEQKTTIPLLGYSELDRNDKSFDLTKNVMAMIKSVATYKALKNTQDLANSIKLLLSTNQIQEAVTDNDNKAFLNKFTGLVETKLSLPHNTIELFDTFYKKIWGGQHLQGKELFSTEGLSNTLGEDGKKISSKKVISTLIMMNNLKALSGNVYSILQNTIGGQMNIWSTASEGIFFTKNQLSQSYSDYIGTNGEENKNKAKSSTEFFGIGRSQGLDRKILNSASSKLVRNITPEKGYIGQEILTSRPIERAITNAMLKNYGLLEGLPVRLEFMPSNTKSLWELAKIGQNGEINSIEGLTNKGKGEFRDIVEKLLGRKTGEGDSSDQSVANTNVLMRVLMEFRGWFMPMYRERFSGTHKDELLKEFMVGKYVAAYHNTLGGVKSTIKEFSKLVAQAASMGLYNGKTNQEAMEFYYHKFLEENPEYKGQLSLERFVSLHEKRIRGTVIELRAMMAITMMLLLLGIDWDDDGKPLYQDNILTRQLYAVLGRGQTELNFFISPISFTKMASNPIPLMGIFTDSYNLIGNTLDETKDFGVSALDLQDEHMIKMLHLDDKNDQTPPLHYTLKMLPFVHSATQFFELGKQATN